jgi:hypothetical protein
MSMPSQVSLQPTAEHVAELRFAASKMHGAERRAFVAEIALKYCNGNARQAEQVFGWGRKMVETGLGERRTGIVCVSAKASFTGNKRWEEKHQPFQGVNSPLKQPCSRNVRLARIVSRF